MSFRMYKGTQDTPVITATFQTNAGVRKNLGSERKKSTFEVNSPSLFDLKLSQFYVSIIHSFPV